MIRASYTLLAMFLCFGLILVLGCEPTPPVDDDDGGDDDGGDDDGADDDGADDDSDYEPECAPPGSSVCGTESAIIRGTVRLDGSIVPEGTTGDLIIGVAHSNLGEGGTGGYYHYFTEITGVDVSAEPFPEFSFDFCLDGEMWSEENCAYNLIAVLDLNGSSSAQSVPIPDPGEPSVRIPDFVISCHADSPCVDVVLDCVDGPSCIQFTSEGCACDTENACGSPIVTCG